MKLPDKGRKLTPEEALEAVEVGIEKGGGPATGHRGCVRRGDRLRAHPFIQMILGLSCLALMGCSAAHLSAKSISPDDITSATLEEFEAMLEQVVSDGDYDPLWEAIVATGRMPLIFDDTAVFMYRGDAVSVTWSADFVVTNQALMKMQGTRLGDSNIWVYKRRFPMDARFSYRIIVSGWRKILDPLNPYQNMEGSGPVSELRMPDYVPPDYVIRRDDVPRGNLSEDIRFQSESLGYDVNYRVYIPVGYSDLQNLPVVYVTDGQEYADDELGMLVIALDNLIADGAIQPVLAVFIDARDPDTGHNRRFDELMGNEKFDQFLVDELVPTIDEAYRTDPTPEARLMMGSSSGGFHALNMGLYHSDTFHLNAALSPHIPDRSLFRGYLDSHDLPIKVFVSAGILGDVDFLGTRDLAGIMEDRGYPYRYLEVSDGHSWGNYHALYDDLLIYFFGTGE